MSTAVCSGNHKDRLIIGDGNFSYTLALINKHDQKAGHMAQQSLGAAIIATELKESFRCVKCDMSYEIEKNGLGDAADEQMLASSYCDKCSTIAKRIAELKVKGATVEFSVDGTKIHEKFPGRTFARIHWNCPHDGSNYKEQTLPPIIEAFFKSCVKVQQVNGRIHLALAQPKEKEDFYQGVVYDILRAATSAGYVLVKKRLFDAERYPGYQHTQTNRNASAAGAERMREFVFEKIERARFKVHCESVKVNGVYPLLPLAQQIAKESEKQYRLKSRVFGSEQRLYIECASDRDSSDCEDPN